MLLSGGLGTSDNRWNHGTFGTARGTEESSGGNSAPGLRAEFAFSLPPDIPPKANDNSVSIEFSAPSIEQEPIEFPPEIHADEHKNRSAK